MSNLLQQVRITANTNMQICCSMMLMMLMSINSLQFLKKYSLTSCINLTIKFICDFISILIYYMTGCVRRLNVLEYSLI